VSDVTPGILIDVPNLCRRLNLDSLELLLEVPDVSTRRRVEVALRVLPASWSLHVDMAREEIAWTLQTLSVNAIELSNLWYMQHFHEKLLVDVSSPTFLKQLPMEAYTFEQVRCASFQSLYSKRIA
jgi:dynein heavy chain